MKERRPSTLLALMTYFGSASLAAAVLGLGAWPLGIFAAYVVRGAIDMPLFRDEGYITKFDEPIEDRIKRRLQLPLIRVGRRFGSGTGQLLGTLFFLALIVAVVAQLPGACSGRTPDHEVEYRAP
jgi:hypothetical protein